MLVREGADVQGADPVTGLMPLMLAARSGHAELCCVLARLGAGLEAADGEGMTALMHAAANGQAEACAALLELAGPAGLMRQLRRGNARAETAVMLAAASGSGETLKVLLRAAAGAAATLLGAQAADGRAAAQHATSDAVRGVIAEAEERAAAPSRDLMEMLGEGKVGGPAGSVGRGRGSTAPHARLDSLMRMGWSCQSTRG